MDMVSCKQALMILNALPKIGPIKIRKLIKHFGKNICSIFSQNLRGELEAIISASDADTIINYRSYFDLYLEERKLESICGRFITMFDDEYPKLLKEIHDSPVGLYVMGDLQASSKNIAIVGSRSATLYGLTVARNLAMKLADRGFCIVSGMARGVDSAAHEGVLSVKGTTVSVLGNGIDVIYPYENKNLRRRIVENGAIISEFPLGHRPDKLTFPIRNRIIAGMCHAVIVVESDKFGGSMITARFANDYGRHVFAVPGRIDSNQSSGCLSLIKDGAIMLTCVEDIFDELPYLSDSIRQETFELKETNPSHATESIDKSKNISCPVERLIYDILKRKKAMSADDVINESNLQTKQVLNALQMLEIRGITFRRYDGLYELKR